MKTVQKILLTGSLIFVIAHGQAQKQTFNWFFGANAGFDFNSGSPVFQPGALNTLEGCASISDKNGQLLFYTDGTTVYNKNHTVMPNGRGLFGGGTGVGGLDQAALHWSGHRAFLGLRHHHRGTECTETPLSFSVHSVPLW